MDREKSDIMEWVKGKNKKEDETIMPMKKGTLPPRYDEAFKAGAIKMVTEQGRPTKEVAAELGICIDTLRAWLKRAGFQPGATDRQKTTSVSGSLRPKTVPCVNSLPRKMR